jgi:hypothetical protein
MSDSETHNRLAKEFVMMAGQQTHSQEELLVVVESMMLASLHLLTKLYRVQPSHASVFLEAALNRATERYSEPKS